MRKLMLVTAGFLGTLAGCSQWGTEPGREAAKEVIKAGNQLTPFPPSFLGHPLAFAGAVFSQLTVFSFSLAVIFYLLHNVNLKRDGCIMEGVQTWQSPVNVYRVSIISFMSAVTFGIVGNLLIFLSWNEVSTATMTIFMTIDKIMKTLAVGPFLYAIHLMVKNDEVVTMQLSFFKVVKPLWPSAPTVKDHGWTVLWILVLATGVTYAKWRAVM